MASLNVRAKTSPRPPALPGAGGEEVCGTPVAKPGPPVADFSEQLATPESQGEYAVPAAVDGGVDDQLVHRDQEVIGCIPRHAGVVDEASRCMPHR